MTDAVAIVTLRNGAIYVAQQAQTSGPWLEIVGCQRVASGSKAEPEYRYVGGIRRHIWPAREVAHVSWLAEEIAA